MASIVDGCFPSAAAKEQDIATQGIQAPQRVEPGEAASYPAAHRFLKFLAHNSKLSRRVADVDFPDPLRRHADRFALDKLRHGEALPCIVSNVGYMRYAF